MSVRAVINYRAGVLPAAQGILQGIYGTSADRRRQGLTQRESLVFSMLQLDLCLINPLSGGMTQPPTCWAPPEHSVKLAALDASQDTSENDLHTGYVRHRSISIRP